MKFGMKITILSSILAFAATAHADHCEWVTPAVAAKAQQLLSAHPKVISFCEPCGDKAPGLPEAASRVDVSSPEVGYNEVVVNGVGLGFVYVQTSPARYENLAMLVGCSPDDVSPSLTVSDETKNGVMITASTTPVVATPPPAPPPPPAARGEVVFIRLPSMLPLLAIVLSGVAGLGAGLAIVLMCARRMRRKRAMQPRAVNLRS